MSAPKCLGRRRDGKPCQRGVPGGNGLCWQHQKQRREGTFEARQSLLAGMEVCARRTFHGMQVDDDLAVGFVEATGDLGSVFHEVAAEILRTMWGHGAITIPTQEAVEIAYEVYARSPVTLPAEERDDLIMLVLQFCKREWDVTKTIAIEERIKVPVVCPDGATRLLSCQPDWISRWGTRLLVIDYKTGWAKPKSPQKPQQGVPDGVAIGMQYLSERGHYQADSYSLAALHRYPQATEVRFREIHLRHGLIREVTLTREEMEHVERQIGVHLQKLDEAVLVGGSSPLWRPRPGKHCTKQCPVAKSCPIPEEQRGAGAIDGQEAADTMAAAYLVVDAQRQQQRAAMQSWFEETGLPLSTGDGREIRWDGGKGGAFEIVDAGSRLQVPPRDLAAAFGASGPSDG